MGSDNDDLDDVAPSMRTGMARLVPHPRAALAAGGAASRSSPRRPLAYIGPGAGFALMSSFLVSWSRCWSWSPSVLAWPFRALWRADPPARGPPKAAIAPLDRRRLRRPGSGAHRSVHARGHAAQLRALAAKGSYRRLQTTYPGAVAGGLVVVQHRHASGAPQHLRFPRSRSPHLPADAVVDPHRQGRAVPALGTLPDSAATPRAHDLLRKSKPFWTILGEHRIWSTILRVPITFPPDRVLRRRAERDVRARSARHAGHVPALHDASAGARVQGGRHPRADVVDRRRPRRHGRRRARTTRSSKGSRRSRCRCAMRLDRAARRAPRRRSATPAVTLAPGELSDWVPLPFHAAPGVTVTGIARLLRSPRWASTSRSTCRRSTSIPKRRRCRSRIPSYYADLSRQAASARSPRSAWPKTPGRSTKASPTTRRSCSRPTTSIASASTMFFAALDRLRRGSLVCVFDATDRIQHMFWRDIDPAHPAAPRPTSRRRIATPSASSTGTTTRWSARVVQQLRAGDVLMVISDHGFSVVPPRRQPERVAAARGLPGAASRAPTGRPSGCATSTGRRPGPTALGLTGMFLNLQGREAAGHRRARRRGGGAQGRDRRQAARPARRRARRRSASAKRSTRPRSTTGPYLENAPDLIIGYNAGYRTSWDCATGVVSGPVFEDNTQGRGAAITASTRGWCPACSSATARSTTRRPVAHRHRAHGAAAVRPRAAGAHGRPAVGRGVVTRAPARGRAWPAAVALAGGALLAACATARTSDRPQGDRARLRRPRLRADARADRPRGRLPQLWRGSPRRAASRRSPRRCRRRARWRGPRSSPASIPASTASSTSSIAIRRRWSRSSRRRAPCRPARMLTLGRWQLPLSARPRGAAARAAQPFWEVLEARGIPTTIMRMPANFPPSGTATRELSGMGTPDMLGTYGIFTLFSSRPEVFERKDVSGGVVQPIDVSTAWRAAHRRPAAIRSWSRRRR